MFNEGFNSKMAAVIFDMDGLMFDTESFFTEVFVNMAHERGREFTYEIKRQTMGRKHLEAMKILIDIWKTADTPEGLVRESTQRYENLLINQAPVVCDGLIELLYNLNKSNVPCIIATASCTRWVELIREIGRAHV